MLIWWWWWNAYVMKFSCWIKMKRSSTNIGDRLVYSDQQTWILPQDIHARLHELNGTWCAWTNEMSVSMSVSSYFYFSFTFTLSHLDSTRHSYIQFSFPIFHSLFLPYTHTHISLLATSTMLSLGRSWYYKMGQDHNWNYDANWYLWRVGPWRATKSKSNDDWCWMPLNVECADNGSESINMNITCCLMFKRRGWRSSSISTNIINKLFQWGLFLIYIYIIVIKRL